MKSLYLTFQAILCAALTILFLSTALIITTTSTVNAAGKYEILPRDPKGSPVPKGCIMPCNCTCKKPIEQNHIKIRAHVTDEFIKHRDWMIDEFFTKHILPAMAMMTSQLSTVMIQQTQIIGTFFDAKHQLETQQLFQQLMAEAHKNYLPSEGLCEIGTVTRSLAASSKRANLGHVVFANRTLQRQLRNADALSAGEENSDINSRIESFIKNNCHAADNTNGLSSLCKSSLLTNDGSDSSNAGASNNNSEAGAGNNNNGAGNKSKFAVKDITPEGGNGKNLKKFTTIEYNNNNDYNNSTGNYTAPQDGTYKFNGNVITQGTNNGVLYIQKNGLNIAEKINTNNNVQSISITTTVNLLEGDVISLYTPQELKINTYSHTFKGELLSDNTNGNGENGSNEKAKETKNKDINFTRTIESKLTLDIDFTDDSEEVSPDETALFALTSNLFAHTLQPAIGSRILATKEGNPREAAYRYMDLRSITAKRSVAQNAFTAIASERVKGDKEVAPFLKKLVTELGVKEKEVEDILGKEPSYFAQMEVLTKDIYQNPVFYTELYDKPANVLRKGTAIRAINLMQERDLYKSQLRSESVLAIILETMLHDEHNRVNGRLSDLGPGGNE